MLRRNFIGSMIGTVVLATTSKTVIATVAKQTDETTLLSRLMRAARLSENDLLRFRSVLQTDDGIIHSTPAAEITLGDDFHWRLEPLNAIMEFQAKQSILLDDEGFVLSQADFYSGPVRLFNGDTLKVTHCLGNVGLVNYNNFDRTIMTRRFDRADAAFV